MLHVNALAPGYGNTPVTAPLHLSLGPKESVLLLGPSGSGKSTALQALGALSKSISGNATLEGEVICSPHSLASDRLRGRRIGFVHQHIGLNPALSLMQNLLMAPYCAGLKQDPGRAASLLERLGLGALQERKPAELSRGQQQRAAVARAVMNRPALLLCDEPTSALDDEATEATATLLQETAAECNAALIIATHDSRLTWRFSAVLRLQPRT